MKPDYRITIAIVSLLIITALFFPPWKHSITGQFSGFYFLFSEAEIVSFLELDYSKLVLIVLTITLIAVSAHLLLLVYREKFLPHISQNLFKKAQSSINPKTYLVTDSFVIIKAIVIFLLGIMLIMLDK